MNSDLLVRFAHFFGILLVAGVLFAELAFLRGVLTRKEIRRLAKIDALYGLGVLLILVEGLLMWLVVGKPR